MLINNHSYTFFLAPMAEVSTPALRKVIKQFCGEVVLYSEMLASGAINAKAPHNEPLVQRHGFDTPFFYQIVGNNPAIMANAASILQDYGCDGIDINMACSAPHIVKAGCGAQLLVDMRHARDIVKSCRKAVKNLLTVKMRAGYHDIDMDYLKQFIVMLQDEGVNAITLHPRAAKWGFSRSAKWDVIDEIVKHAAIPIIGNGDITTPQLAMQRLHQTRCAGIMIGRAAVQQPWIFALCNALYNNNPLTVTIDHAALWIDVLTNIQTMLPQKLHKSRAHRFCFYFAKNCTFGHELFTIIRKLSAIDDIIKTINDYYMRNPMDQNKHYRVP
ncbi:MAG TPA: tRNA-dihydrouridine synthase family protein [Spirochaetota bacterium]|nr:tRNA-dihydrouridine synthase family protein [Spirochaetota bacterium]HOF13734.1 tRNA-dihydrouridine synthase family protein [Spirochaetota bacterium]HOM88196.1 tRNA-dihydrouridine synthase family protein [Spirochaetota bacterium]HOR94211.1 tRNA-dihydrouridine synthase family protein [Spirochaetota bacterium]HOT19776.1 tRNA-dihydrouridine synthase family protein [Spirochaetota bacterium]